MSLRKLKLLKVREGGGKPPKNLASLLLKFLVSLMKHSGSWLQSSHSRFLLEEGSGAACSLPSVIPGTRGDRTRTHSLPLPSTFLGSGRFSRTAASFAAFWFHLRSPSWTKKEEFEGKSAEELGEALLVGGPPGTLPCLHHPGGVLLPDNCNP